MLLTCFEWEAEVSQEAGSGNGRDCSSSSTGKYKRGYPGDKLK
jgi:hypothetical protein